MLIETGKVLAVESQCLWVETIRRSTCHSCSAQAGCGQGILNRAGLAKEHRLRVFLNGMKAEQFAVGQFVQLSIPENILLRASVVAYLLPLLLFFVGASLTPELSGGGELYSVIGGALGLLLGLALVKLHAGRNRNNPDYQPQLIANQSQEACFTAAESVKIIEP